MHSGVTSVCVTVCVCESEESLEVLKASRMRGESRGREGGVGTLWESKVDSKTNAMTSKVLVAYFNLV